MAHGVRRLRLEHLDLADGDLGEAEPAKPASDPNPETVVKAGQYGFTVFWGETLRSQLAERMAAEEVTKLTEAVAAQVVAEVWRTLRELRNREREYRLARDALIKAR